MTGPSYMSRWGGPPGPSPPPQLFGGGPPPPYLAGHQSLGGGMVTTIFLLLFFIEEIQKNAPTSKISSKKCPYNFAWIFKLPLIEWGGTFDRKIFPNSTSLVGVGGGEVRVWKRKIFTEKKNRKYSVFSFRKYSYLSHLCQTESIVSLVFSYFLFFSTFSRNFPYIFSTFSQKF